MWLLRLLGRQDDSARIAQIFSRSDGRTAGSRRKIDFIYHKMGVRRLKELCAGYSVWQMRMKRKEIPWTKMKLILLLVLMAMSATVSAQTARLLVHIGRFENDNGTVHVTLKDSSRKIVAEKKVPISNESAEVTFDKLQPGRYAIRVYHDENGNGKLDRALLGIRKESWGVSNDSLQTFGPARFRKMLFEVRGNTEIAISVRN
jgi:uncharacterized protein (DUF2141 family)